MGGLAAVFSPCLVASPSPCLPEPPLDGTGSYSRSGPLGRHKKVASGPHNSFLWRIFARGRVSSGEYPRLKWGQCFFRGVTPQPFETPVKACRTGACATPWPCRR